MQIFLFAQIQLNVGAGAPGCFTKMSECLMVLNVIKICEVHPQASEVVILEVFSNHGDFMICIFVLYGNTSHEYKTLSAVTAQPGQKHGYLASSAIPSL